MHSCSISLHNNISSFGVQWCLYLCAINPFIFSHLFINMLTKEEAYVCVFVVKPGPSLVGAVKKDWASPNSIALSWQQPEQMALPILDYEIKYYEKVQLKL